MDKSIGKLKIKSSDHHTYLGDIIESDHSNRKNVLSRATKGKIVVRDILQIINGVYLGDHYFEALKLL